MSNAHLGVVKFEPPKGAIKGPGPFPVTIIVNVGGETHSFKGRIVQAK